MAPEQTAENAAYVDKGYRLRNQYDNVADNKYAYGRDLEADKRKAFDDIQAQIRARAQRETQAWLARDAERRALREQFRHEFGVDMLNPEHLKRGDGIIDKAIRYGPPAAVGAYGGSKALQLLLNQYGLGGNPDNPMLPGGVGAAPY